MQPAVDKMRTLHKKNSFMELCEVIGQRILGKNFSEAVFFILTLKMFPQSNCMRLIQVYNFYVLTCIALSLVKMFRKNHVSFKLSILLLAKD